MNGSGSKSASNIVEMLEKIAKLPNFEKSRGSQRVNQPDSGKKFFKTHFYVLSGHKNQVWSKKISPPSWLTR